MTWFRLQAELLKEGEGDGDGEREDAEPPLDEQLKELELEFKRKS